MSSLIRKASKILEATNCGQELINEAMKRLDSASVTELTEKLIVFMSTSQSMGQREETIFEAIETIDSQAAKIEQLEKAATTTKTTPTVLPHTRVVDNSRLMEEYIRGLERNRIDIEKYSFEHAQLQSENANLNECVRNLLTQNERLDAQLRDAREALKTAGENTPLYQSAASNPNSWEVEMLKKQLKTKEEQLRTQLEQWKLATTNYSKLETSYSQVCDRLMEMTKVVDKGDKYIADQEIEMKRLDGLHDKALLRIKELEESLREHTANAKEVHDGMFEKIQNLEKQLLATPCSNKPDMKIVDVQQAKIGALNEQIHALKAEKQGMAAKHAESMKAVEAENESLMDKLREVHEGSSTGSSDVTILKRRVKALEAQKKLDDKEIHTLKKAIEKKNSDLVELARNASQQSLDLIMEVGLLKEERDSLAAQVESMQEMMHVMSTPEEEQAEDDDAASWANSDNYKSATNTGTSIDLEDQAASGGSVVESEDEEQKEIPDTHFWRNKGDPKDLFYLGPNETVKLIVEGNKTVHTRYCSSCKGRGLALASQEQHEVSVAGLTAKKSGNKKAMKAFAWLPCLTCHNEDNAEHPKHTVPTREWYKDPSKW